MASTDKLPQLSFQMTPEVAVLLADLQDGIRAAGHARPSQKTLVEALIQHAPRGGEELERDVLVPFRKAHAEAD